MEGRSRAFRDGTPPRDDPPRPVIGVDCTRERSRLARRDRAARRRQFGLRPTAAVVAERHHRIVEVGAQRARRMTRRPLPARRASPPGRRVGRHAAVRRPGRRVGGHAAVGAADERHDCSREVGTLSKAAAAPTEVDREGWLMHAGSSKFGDVRRERSRPRRKRPGPSFPKGGGAVASRRPTATGRRERREVHRRQPTAPRWSSASASSSCR